MRRVLNKLICLWCECKIIYPLLPDRLHGSIKWKVIFLETFHWQLNHSLQNYFLFLMKISHFYGTPLYETYGASASLPKDTRWNPLMLSRTTLSTLFLSTKISFVRTNLADTTLSFTTRGSLAPSSFIHIEDYLLVQTKDSIKCCLRWGICAPSVMWMWN